MRKRRYLLFFALVLCVLSMANAVSSRMDAIKYAGKGGKDSIIFLLHADRLSFNQYQNPDAQILNGHVAFRHNKALMYCDSAQYYKESNSFEAFGHVKMKQGDTLTLTGNYLYYDGNTQLAEVRDNVVLTHRKTILYTDSLNYDRLYGLGYFMDGGTLVDDDNKLTSDWGEYSPSKHEALFNYNVNLTNPRFELKTDTLHYNTVTNMAHFTGPSNVDSKDNHIYSESGYYNTRTEDANLVHRSVLVNPERRLVGDSVVYSKLTGEGEGFGHVVVTNLKDKNQLVGDYCYYNDSTGVALATGHAVAKDFSQARTDTLFMHADSLRMYSYNLRTDSLYRVIHAYHKGRVYRSDVQAVSDSIVYNQKDSCLTLYANPVVWNKDMQLVGERIRVYSKDSTISWAHVELQALSVEQVDSIHYNQLSGKDMKAFFDDEGELRQTNVQGNVEFVFYPLEKDSTLSMMHTGQDTEMRFYLKDRKLTKIWGGTDFSATGYPIGQIPADKMKLKNFLWLDYLRPKNKDDIFEWVERKAGDEAKAAPVRQVPLVNLKNLKDKNK